MDTGSLDLYKMKRFLLAKSDLYEQNPEINIKAGRVSSSSVHTPEEANPCPKRGVALLLPLFHSLNRTQMPSGHGKRGILS